MAKRGGGWGYALAAGVEGWMRGDALAKQNEAYEKDQKWKDEQRARTTKQQGEEDQEKADVKNAARPVAMEEGAGGYIKPASMDNRDVGLPENADLPNQGLQQGGYQVAGKTFTEKPLAEAAVKIENAPEAVNARVAGAYRANGKIDKAMAIESADRTATIQKQQIADVTFKRDLGRAAQGGHQGIADFVSKSEVGPMKGMQVQAVPSADGKTVTYAAKGPDGTMQPIPGIPKFSNDQNGLFQAMVMLDSSIDPMQKLQHSELVMQREQAQKNSDRTFGLAQNQDARSAQAADQTGAEHRLRMEKGALELEDARTLAKIPAAVKDQIAHYRKETENIGKVLDAAMLKDDWNPNSPGTQALLERQATLTRQMNALYAKHASRNPDAPKADPWDIKEQRGKTDAPKGEHIDIPKSYKDPAYDRAEEIASARTGVPASAIRTIRMKGEMSNDDQVSEKGAKTVYQFTPTSRDLFLKKYGVDAYSKNAVERATAAALHLKEGKERTGSYRAAAAGYNGGISAEKGTNTTAENKAYRERTGPAMDKIDQSMAARGTKVSNWANTNFAQGTPAAPTPVAPPAVASAVGATTAPIAPTSEEPPIDYSGARSPNASARPGVPAPDSDPMAAIYAKQAAELQRGLRTELSPDVKEWLTRVTGEKAKDDERRFNAAQAHSMQDAKLKADANKAKKS